MFLILDIVEVSLSFPLFPDNLICLGINNFLFNAIILETEREVDFVIPTLNLDLWLKVWLL